MSGEISWWGLLLALVLPWFCGAVWLRRLLYSAERLTAPVVLGQGFFVGYFALTLLLRLWDAVGLSLNFKLIALLLGVIGIAGLLFGRRAYAIPASPVPAPAKTIWQTLLVSALLLLLSLRYGTLLTELLLRPPFAWDTWMNWAPKAIVWFHQGSLTPFVSPMDWGTPGHLDAYTLGNAHAWNYPLSIPLIQLWCMLGAGTFDHGAVYLPWLLVPVNLGLAFYAYLRRAGVAVTSAVIALYLLLSMPYLNVHAVLAGYADLWLAAMFTLSVCALFEYERYREVSAAVLVIVFAAFSAVLKVQGVFLALILLAALVRAHLQLNVRRELVLLVVGGLLFYLALVVGVRFYLPHIGEVVFGLEEVRLGDSVAFKPAYHAVGSAFFDAFFTMVNWHTLFYLVVLLSPVALVRAGLTARVPSDVLATVTAMAALAAVFFFSGFYREALNHAALSRTMLYCVPAVLWCMARQLVTNDGALGRGG